MESFLSKMRKEKPGVQKGSYNGKAHHIVARKRAPTRHKGRKENRDDPGVIALLTSIKLHREGNQIIASNYGDKIRAAKRENLRAGKVQIGIQQQGVHQTEEILGTIHVRKGILGDKALHASRKLVEDPVQNLCVSQEIIVCPIAVPSTIFTNDAASNPPINLDFEHCSNIPLPDFSHCFNEPLLCILFPSLRPSRPKTC